MYEGLLAGDFCYVLTSRQMGKSSLMVRTVQRLRADGRAVAVLDLTAIGQNLTVEQWYNGLLERLGRQLDLEDELDDFRRSHKHLSPVQRWFAAIREVILHDEATAKELVIFVDEIDAVRSLPFSTDEFFAAIRECYNRRSSEPSLERLTFCLLGVATPSDLIRDTRTTPFNIGRRIELRDFTLAEAGALLDGLVERFGDELGERVLERVQHWTNGQPYLTQLFCRTLVERKEVQSLRDVDHICTELFLTEQAAEKNDNLVFVRERLLRSEVDRFELLQLYAKVLNGGHVLDDPSNPLICVLRLAGVTREDEGRLAVRSPIYQRVFDCRWVRENLPDAELRRQRKAYWQGVVRAAVWASVGLAVIGTLWVDARFQAVRADQSAARELEQRLIAVQAEQEAVKAERQLRAVLSQMESRQAEDMFSDGRSPMGLALLAHLLRSDPHNEAAAQRLVYALSQRSFALPVDEESVQVHFPRPSGDYRLEKSESGTEVLVYRHADNELIATLKHDGQVQSEQLSPDGLMVVTACFDDTVRLWETRTGKPLLPPLRHDGPVWNAVFSPEGLRVVSSSLDRAARVWDVTTGELLVEPIMYDRGGGFVAEFSDDGTKILMRSRFGRGRSRTTVWDVRERGMQAAPLAHKQPVGLIRLSPDGNWLVTVTSGNHLRLWRVIDGALLHEVELDRAVTALDFAGDSKGFLCGISSGAVTWHPVPDISASATWFSADGAITSLEYSADGARVLIADARGELRILEATNRAVVLAKSLGGEITKATLSREGDRFLTATTDRKVQVWSVADGARLHEEMGHFSPVVDAAFGPGGKRVVTLSYGFSGRATFWDLADGLKETGLEHNSSVSSIDMHPNGTAVVTASRDRSARIWDLTAGEVQGAQLMHDGPVVQALFFPDGWRLLTATSTHHGRIWNAEGGQPLSELFRAPHSHHYAGLFPPQRSEHASVSATGRRFAIATDDRTVRVWTTLNPPLPVPEWLPDVAEAIGGQRVNERGSVVTVDRRGLAQLRKRIEHLRTSPFHTEWLQWLLADRDQRPVAPGDSTTFAELVDRLLLDGSMDRVREAARLAPTNPAVLEKLAELILASEDPDAEIRARHLREAARRYRTFKRE